MMSAVIYYAGYYASYLTDIMQQLDINRCSVEVQNAIALFPKVVRDANGGRGRPYFNS